MVDSLQLPKQGQLKRDAIDRDFRGLLSEKVDDIRELAIQVKPKDDIKPKVFRLEDEEEEAFDEETTNKLFTVIDDIKVA